MAIKLTTAFSKINHLVEKPCSVEIGNSDGEIFLLSPGKWDGIVFDWPSLSNKQQSEFIDRYLGDSFFGADDYVIEKNDLSIWINKGLIPFAFIGPKGMLKNGYKWNNGNNVSVILFFDLENGKNGDCPVRCWTGGKINIKQAYNSINILKISEEPSK